MAILVGTCMYDVMMGINIKEPPWPTNPPKKPTELAVVTAFTRLKENEPRSGRSLSVSA